MDKQDHDMIEAMQQLGYAKAVNDMLTFVLEFQQSNNRLPELSDIMVMLKTMNDAVPIRRADKL